MFKKIALTYVATMALIFGAVAVAPATADTPAGESNVSTVQLSGVLRSADGQPVTNMKITVARFVKDPGVWGPGGFDSPTDEFGRFGGQLLAGETYGIWASRFSTGETEVIRDAFPVYFDVYFGMHEMTEDLALDLSLPGTKTIDFQIVDHTGEPVVGVSTETWFNCSLACQENGQYFYSGGWSLSDENGNVSLIIFEDSAELGSSTLTGVRSDGLQFLFKTSVSQTNSTQVTIPQMSKVSGILRTASGVPVANASVVANFTSEGVYNQQTRTDDAGNYFLSVPTGETFSLEISGNEGEGTLPNLGVERLPMYWHVGFKAKMTLTEDSTVDFNLPATKALNLNLIDSKGNPFSLTYLGADVSCLDSVSEDPIYESCESRFWLSGDEVDRGLSFVTFNDAVNLLGFVRGVDSAGLPVLFDLSTPRPYISGESQVGSQLRVANEWEDFESESLLSYKWLRDGVAIDGATSANYLLTRADNFHEISVQVTNSAAGLNTSAVSPPVQVNSLTYSAAPTISGSTNVGDVLQVIPGIWDQDVFAKRGYQWLRDGVPIEGAIGRTYVLQASDVAHRISVQESVFLKGFDSASSVSEQMPAVKAIPRKTMSKLVAPVVKGKPKVGSVLSSSVTSMGSGVVHSYQWFRDGVAIEAANERKYVLAAEDANASVTFQVCGSKLSYETACLESNSTVVALGELRRKPKVGLKWTSVKPGAVIESRSGTWDADVNLTYSWLRDGVEIANETAASYQVTEADRGHTIAFKVVAQKPGYNEVVRTSVAKLIP